MDNLSYFVFFRTVDIAQRRIICKHVERDCGGLFENLPAFIRVESSVRKQAIRQDSNPVIKDWNSGISSVHQPLSLFQ
jgi:hypothetical protein